MRYYKLDRETTDPKTGEVLPAGTVLGLVDSAFGFDDVHTMVKATDVLDVADHDLLVMDTHVRRVIANTPRVSLPADTRWLILPSYCRLCGKSAPLHSETCAMRWDKRSEQEKLEARRAHGW